VAVSLQASGILADWRAERRTTAIGFTVFAVTLVGFVVVLFRQIDARARVEGTLEQLQRVEADRLKEANQRLEEALRREKRAREETEEASRLKADADRLQQVVWNLLSNAIKFTPSGGTVKLRVSDTDGGVEILVRDSGSGIPAAFLPFVFDRFRHADAGTRRETGGLGLGLAIARHVVELHGGTMTAESEGEGQGATFRVFLPRLAKSV